MVVPTETIVRGIGVQLETAQIADLLSRMQLQAQPVQGSAAVRVLVPPTRSDVLHACDVMEVSRSAGPLIVSCASGAFQAACAWLHAFKTVNTLPVIARNGQ